MNVVKPIVGQWYRGGTNELFEVVAIDDKDETIEVQYFDGTVTEIDFDAWNEQLLDELIDVARRSGGLVGSGRCRSGGLGSRIRGQLSYGLVESPGSFAAPLGPRVRHFARFECADATA